MVATRASGIGFCFYANLAFVVLFVQDQLRKESQEYP